MTSFILNHSFTKNTSGNRCVFLMDKRSKKLGGSETSKIDFTKGIAKKASQEENQRFWVPVMVIQKVYKIAV